MKIAICDDNREYIKIIEKYLEEFKPQKIECDVFTSGEELLSAYKNYSDYDAVFLDMEMGELDGIETANRIREINEHIIIVFVTSHSEYMKESFKCQPFRFLEKPIEFDETREVINDIYKKLSKRRKVFAFTENKRKVRLFCDDIIYCESQGHYIWIHTKDEVYKISNSLSKLYELLDKEMIYRIHKSFIINFHYIKSIRKTDVELYHCDKLIPISRSYKNTALQDYTNFIERNLYL